MYSFSYLESVCCSMSSSNCCFLTCIQISQEAGQVVWYSHLFQNFLVFIVIHTVKGFGIVNKAEIDVFLELSCVFDEPEDVGNLISGSSAFSKTSLNTSLVVQMVKHLPTIWETRVHSLGWEHLLEKEMATHPSILAWKIPWMEEPGRLSMAFTRHQICQHLFLGLFQPPEL